ncbi:MAG: NAD-dependent epimerase/dehydratase family protein [Bacteroidota bacterium]
MKIFVTGASGFVGGAITKRLLREGHEVLAMARSQASAEKVRALGAKAVECDLDTVQAAHLREVEIVVHCAAFVEPWGTRAQFWSVNVDGTQHMIAASKEASVKRFIHMGTEAALFRGQHMENIDEDYPYPKSSPFLYSETKREAEKLVLEANQEGKFETLSLRPRFVWGPGDTTILPNLLEMVDKGRFRWINRGQTMTSSTHIDNLVEGTVKALENGRGGEAYFLTDGEPVTFRRLLTGLVESAGRTPGNKNAPGWFVRAAAWGVETVWKTLGIRKKPPITRFAANIMSRTCTIKSEKAKQELGYVPVMSFENGMKGLKVNTAG